MRIVSNTLIGRFLGCSAGSTRGSIGFPSASPEPSASSAGGSALGIGVHPQTRFHWYRRRLQCDPPRAGPGRGGPKREYPRGRTRRGRCLVAFRRSLARHTLASHGRSQRRPPSRGSRALGSSRLRRDVAEGRLAAIRGDCRSPRRICGRRRQRGTRPGTARRGLRFRLGRWRALLRHHLLHGRGTEVLPALPGRACRPSAGDRSRRARPLPGGRTSARFPSPTWLAFHCCHPASGPATTAGCRGRG